MSLTKFIFGLLLTTLVAGYAHAGDPACNEAKLSKKEQKACDAAILRVAQLTVETIQLTVKVVKDMVAFEEEDLGEEACEDAGLAALKGQLAVLEAQAAAITVESILKETKDEGGSPKSASEINAVGDEIQKKLDEAKASMDELSNEG